MTRHLKLPGILICITSLLIGMVIMGGIHANSALAQGGAPPQNTDGPGGAFPQGGAPPQNTDGPGGPAIGRPGLPPDMHTAASGMTGHPVFVGGPTALSASGAYVYVLRGGTLYQFRATDLALVTHRDLPPPVRPAGGKEN